MKISTALATRAAVAALALVLVGPRAVAAKDPFPFRMAEAADGKLAIPAPGPDIQRAITLVGVNAQAEVIGAQVTLGPLSRQDARPILSETLVCVGCGVDLKLPKGAWLSLTLIGKGLGIGEYTSFLQMTAISPTAYATSTVIPITISRGPLTLTTQILTPSAWAATAGRGTRFPIDVRETSGRDIIIRPPSISPLQVEIKSGVWKGVEDVQFRQLSVQADNARGSAVASQITLTGGAYTRFFVDFGGLPAGSYKGQIRVNGLEGSEMVQDFQIALKDDWPWPLIVIALGVAGAFFLQRWTHGERDRLLRRARIRAEREAVQRDYDRSLAKPDEVWEYLLALLNSLLDGNAVALPGGAETDATVKTALDDARKRRLIYLPLLDLKRRIDAVLEALPAEMADKKRDFERKADSEMRDARRNLASPDSVDKLDGTLRGTFNDIRKAAIDTPATRLKDEIAATNTFVAANFSRLDLADASKPDMQPQNDAVDEAQRLAGQGEFEKAGEQLERARAGLFDVRRALIELCKAALIRKAQTNATHLAALTTWLDTTDSALLAATAEGPTDKGLNLLEAAARAFNDALSEYQKLTVPAAPAASGGRSDYGADAKGEVVLRATETGLLPSVARLVGAFLLGDPLPGRAETASSLAGRIRRYDWLVMVAVIIAACLTGMVSQYADAPAFGGKDYVTAFLWGFGWQALTGTLTSLATEAGLVKGAAQGVGG